MNGQSDICTAAMAARMLGLHPSTIHFWRRTGKLTPLGRLPNSWIYRLSDIRKLVSERTPTR